MNYYNLLLYVLILITLALSIFVIKKLEIVDALNIIILSFTALALVWTTIDSKRNFVDTQLNNLRPVILRSGYINYTEVQFLEDINKQNDPQFIEFINYKNIAKDLSGYIIIKNRKYELLFQNDITQKIIPDEKQTVRIGLLKQWGWLPVDGKIFALPRKEGSKEINEKNQIYITYKDIEGNSYFTKENENYSQASERIIRKAK
jgi:hypothetical protein